MDEIEVRARWVTSRRELDQLLKTRQLRPDPPILQIDHIFDRPDASLFRSGEKIRVRVNDDASTEITYKSSMAARSDVSVRREVNVQISPESKTEAFQLLEVLGYPHLYTLPKRRERVAAPHVAMTIDEWPIIGTVLELEGEEDAIVAMANELFPHLDFRNYRLSELADSVMHQTGKTFSELQQRAESDWGMEFGNLELALGMKSGD